MKVLKNKEGFTLVELLAVIVVLAIIMIIAVPNVLTSMNTAKKSSFVVEARKVLNKAQEQYQTDSLTKAAAEMPTCYSLADLNIETGGKYYGSVSVTNNEFKIYLYDGSYAVQGKTSTELNTDSNINETTTKPEKIDSCGA